MTVRLRNIGPCCCVLFISKQYQMHRSKETVFVGIPHIAYIYSACIHDIIVCVRRNNK